MQVGIFYTKPYLPRVKCDYEIIVIGGGLAGLTAAIHLVLEGRSVLVIEKNEYPNHKVCGEYVSNEVVPYLKRLDVGLQEKGAVSIQELQFSTVRGVSVKSKLPLGGVGISRYAFDHHLFQRAQQVGVHFLIGQVNNVLFKDSYFEVNTSLNETITSIFTIGAYGKRSVLDKALDRSFIQNKSSWMAVKNHYHLEDFPEHLVGLHNFEGGYGGLSKTENGAVNFCYLASYDSFQKAGNIENYNQQVVSKNPFLGNFLKEAQPVFDQPLTIAQISFEPKQAVENHIIMCGDTAGLIHPLCGNGMAMAIHSAKIASELLVDFFSGSTMTREQLEKNYIRKWKKAFQKRIWWGRQLQKILLKPKLSNILLKAVGKTPGLLNFMVKCTHGKPIS
ncbi:NAD(P)/FAD-dependent oxidoreductase [Euzebyella marina]|uniref:NAD(P)/FAD-dependent oxidoreductase n=1 Tax=Euzebyella marina TaxID=1761453 RepID=A0A3G2L784_9FLAO|nr:NAD(P)/FAD-dependent oxidoreductase [Euzebyella marina]